MKKLFLGAIAAMTLAACSQEEDFETQNVEKQLNGIEYNVSTKNQTRVDASYGSKNLPSSFKVWALKNGDTSADAYINGKTITKGTDGTYAAETADTWPGYALNFFATVNGDATITSGTAAIKDFTVNSDATKQVDLLYAVTPGVNSGTVGINFKHALSQVCFKAKNSNKNIKVVLKSVGIGGLNDKGTYTLPSTSSASGSWGTLSNSGTGLAEYAVSLGDGVTLTSGDDAQQLGYSDSDVSGILAVIPQKQTKLTVASGTSSIAKMTKNGAYFVLNAVVTNTDASNTTKYEGNIYVPVSIDFQEGNRYVYTLTFSTGDGGYCDNGSSLLNASMNVNYNVSTADVVDKDNTTEATTETKVTKSLSPTLDCWLRSDNTSVNNAAGATMEVKTYTDNEDSSKSRYFYGLMSFSLPEGLTTNYTVKSAKLVLTSRFIKGGKTMTLYDFGGDALLESQPSYPGTKGEVLTLSGYTKISDFTANGTNTAIDADKITNSSYFNLSAWKTEIDLTTYFNSSLKTDYINLLFANNSSSNESNVFFTSAQTDDITMTTQEGESEAVKTTIKVADLVPYLVIEYAEK